MWGLAGHTPSYGTAACLPSKQALELAAQRGAVLTDPTIPLTALPPAPASPPGTVLKRFDSSKLYVLACQDVVERFHLLITLSFVLVEEMGSSGHTTPNRAILVQVRGEGGEGRGSWRVGTSRRGRDGQLLQLLARGGNVTCG